MSILLISQIKYSFYFVLSFLYRSSALLPFAFYIIFTAEFAHAGKY